MKNVFVVLLAILVSSINADDDIGQLTITFAQTGTQVCFAGQKQHQRLHNERSFRREIYWYDRHNPRYYLLERFPFDYVITIISDHIKVLERKILLKQTGLKSNGMCIGTIVSLLSAIPGCAAYASYQKSKGCAADKYEEWIMNTIVFSLVSAIFMAIAGSHFHKVSRYAERLIERLERDKRILAVLEREKAVKDSNCTNNYTDTAGLNNLVNSVVNVIILLPNHQLQLLQ